MSASSLLTGTGRRSRRLRRRQQGLAPPPPGNLTNLEGLQLHNNQLNGEVPAELGNLTNLEVLWLPGSPLEFGSGLSCIQKRKHHAFETMLLPFPTSA